MACVVTAVDAKDPVVQKYMAYKCLRGEHAGRIIKVSSVADLAAQVTQVASREKIYILRLVDHGYTDGFEVGNDIVTEQNIENYYQSFAKIGETLNADAQVNLFNCSVGSNVRLMTILAEMLQAVVIAGMKTTDARVLLNKGPVLAYAPTGLLGQTDYYPLGSAPLSQVVASDDD